MIAGEYHRFAMGNATDPIDWNRIDTVLLDMDGTLLDLAFDNLFWLELVPREYARAHGLRRDEARERIRELYASVLGQLSWYCVDHWTRQLGIGIAELKWAHRRLIGFLPGVPTVLRQLRARGKRLLVVTNAHRETLAVKLHQTRLDVLVDGIVCSHDYGAEKESATFWETLTANEPLDPERTVFFDDSEPVLRAAGDFGLQHRIAIRRPDSGKPAKPVAEMASIDGLAELGPTLTVS